ncbi:MAG: SDR family oxidoreductase [Marmoricola sp.]
MTRTPRTHVITGAASGIGLEVARRLIDRGDRVVLLVHSEPRVDELAQALPGPASILVVDLADPEAIAEFADDFQNGTPKVELLDSLLHIAGVVELSTVSNLDVGDWQRQLDVNLTGPAVLTARLLPALRRARGTVMFVNSGAGLAANPSWAAYAASKFGLRALADALRAEEAAHGVRVTTVYPSRTATPMQEKVHRTEGREYDASRWIQPSTVADAMLHVLELPDDATITELTVRPTGG